MKPIDFSFIEQASETLSTLSDDALEQLVDQLSTQQPFLITYLIASQEENLHEDEQELLFYLGIQILYIVREAGVEVPEISEQFIDERIMDNDDLATELAEENTPGFQQRLEDVMDNHPQGDLIQFAFLAITEEDEEEDELIFDDDSRSMVFIVLKVLIDCLHHGAAAGAPQ